MKRILTSLILLLINSLCFSQTVIQKTPLHDTLTKWLAPKDNPQYAGGTYTYDYILWIRYNYSYKIVHDTIIKITPPVSQTKWSVMVPAQANNAATVSLADQYGTKTVRWAILYSDYKDETEMHLPLLDAYVAAGYQLVLNINGSRPIEGKPTLWVHDLPRWRRFVKAVIKAYGPHIDWLVTENEENNIQYHLETIYQGYLDELSIAVQEGHAAGLKVTNGGLSMITEAQSKWAPFAGYRELLLAERATGMDAMNMHDKHSMNGKLSTKLAGGAIVPISLNDKIAYSKSILPGFLFGNNEAGTTGDFNYEKKEYEDAGYVFVTQYCMGNFYLSPQAFKSASK